MSHKNVSIDQIFRQNKKSNVSHIKIEIEQDFFNGFITGSNQCFIVIKLKQLQICTQLG